MEFVIVFLAVLTANLISVQSTACEKDCDVGNITSNPYFAFRNAGWVCDVSTCIKKCCAKGEYLADKDQCEKTKENFTSALYEIVPEDYLVIYQPCRGVHETLLLDPLNITEDAFRINKDGVLVLMESGETYENYCVDFIESTDVVRALLCFETENGNTGSHHVIIGNYAS